MGNPFIDLLMRRRKSPVEKEWDSNCLYQQHRSDCHRFISLHSNDPGSEQAKRTPDYPLSVLQRIVIGQQAKKTELTQNSPGVKSGCWQIMLEPQKTNASLITVGRAIRETSKIFPLLHGPKLEDLLVKTEINRVMRQDNNSQLLRPNKKILLQHDEPREDLYDKTNPPYLAGASCIGLDTERDDPVIVNYVLNTMHENRHNFIRIWLFMAWPRSGETLPDYPLPYNLQEDNYHLDLRSFDQSYFNLLLSLIIKCNFLGIIPILSIADGSGLDTPWSTHPWNASCDVKKNGVHVKGDMTNGAGSRSDVLEIMDSSKNFGESLRQFLNYLIDYIAGQNPHLRVSYEIFNEARYLGNPDPTSITNFHHQCNSWIADLYANIYASAPLPMIMTSSVVGLDWLLEWKRTYSDSFTELDIVSIHNIALNVWGLIDTIVGQNSDQLNKDAMVSPDGNESTYQRDFYFWNRFWIQEARRLSQENQCQVHFEAFPERVNVQGWGGFNAIRDCYDPNDYNHALPTLYNGGISDDKVDYLGQLEDPNEAGNALNLYRSITLELLGGTLVNGVRYYKYSDSLRLKLYIRGGNNLTLDDIPFNLTVMIEIEGGGSGYWYGGQDWNVDPHIVEVTADDVHIYTDDNGLVIFTLTNLGADVIEPLLNKQVTISGVLLCRTNQGGYPIPYGPIAPSSNEHFVSRAIASLSCKFVEAY